MTYDDFMTELDSIVEELTGLPITKLAKNHSDVYDTYALLESLYSGFYGYDRGDCDLLNRVATHGLKTMFLKILEKDSEYLKCWREYMDSIPDSDDPEPLLEKVDALFDQDFPIKRTYITIVAGDKYVFVDSPFYPRSKYNGEVNHSLSLYTCLENSKDLFEQIVRRLTSKAMLIYALQNNVNREKLDTYEDKYLVQKGINDIKVIGSSASEVLDEMIKKGFIDSYVIEKNVCYEDGHMVISDDDMPF